MVIYLNAAFYIATNPNVNIYLRIVRSFILVTLVFILFQLSKACSQIGKNAHKVRKKLQSYLVNSKVNLKIRLKISSFIEKLDSKEIGLYCYEFFPMNEFEFFKYIANIVFNYFLIVECLKIN